MRCGKIFFSAAILIFITMIVTIGIAFLMVPWTSNLKDSIVEFLNNDSQTIAVTGIAFIVFGTILLAVLFRINRRMYFNIQMGSHLVSVDTKAIETYLNAYWEKSLPSSKVFSDVVTKRNNIEIIVRFQELPSEDLEIFLENVERELSKALSKAFFYNKTFTFSFSIPS